MLCRLRGFFVTIAVFWRFIDTKTMTEENMKKFFAVLTVAMMLAAVNSPVLARGGHGGGNGAGAGAGAGNSDGGGNGHGASGGFGGSDNSAGNGYNGSKAQSGSMDGTGSGYGDGTEPAPQDGTGFGKTNKN